MLKIAYEGIYACKRARAGRHGFYDPNAKNKKLIGQEMAIQAMCQNASCLNGPIGCICVFYKRWPKSFSQKKKDNLTFWDTKPDSDNLEKFLFDCLEKNAGLIENDSRICAKITLKLWGPNDYTAFIIGGWRDSSFFTQSNDLVAFNNVGFRLHSREFFQLSDKF